MTRDDAPTSLQFRKETSAREPAFASTTHCRLLLRVDRTFAIQRALASAVSPGSRVLDAGCGSGILSFLAVAAGAREVVAVDRENVALARALANENGLAPRIEFVEADLRTLDLPGRAFDVLLAFVYTNHVVVDEARSALVYALRDKLGATACQTIPNRVRYLAAPCDWPQVDARTELTDLRNAIGDLEKRYALKLQSLLEVTSAEVMLGRARPRIHGDYEWAPAGGSGGYRHARGAFRLLGEPAVVAEISYDSGPRFDRLPPGVQLEIASPGICSAVLWTQELWFNDFLIWTAEHFSPLAKAVSVEPGEVVRLALDDDWRRTNVLSTEA
jgi:SAM-dependent methyltransferase